MWMGAKQLTYADEARQKLLAGASKLARAVRATLGPRGRNAVLDKGWGAPTITKDGVTVAGTTTATVLAEFVYREGLRGIAAGHDPMALTRGIQKGVDRVVEELHK